MEDERRLVQALAAAAAVLLAGCNTQGITSPNSPLACGGGVVTVAVLNSVTLDCRNGATAITLAGGGASYLVVPQFATSQAQKQLFPYTIGVGGGAVAAVRTGRGRPPAGLLSSATIGPSVNGRSAAGPGLLQRRFDGLRRRAERANLRNGRWRVQTRASVSITPSNVTAPVPTLGSLRDFHVLATIGAANPMTTQSLRPAAVPDPPNRVDWDREREHGAGDVGVLPGQHGERRGRGTAPVHCTERLSPGRKFAPASQRVSVGNAVKRIAAR